MSRHGVRLGVVCALTAAAIVSGARAVAGDGEGAEDALALVGSADAPSRDRGSRALSELRAKTTRGLLVLATQSLREGREEVCVAAIQLLGSWRSEDAISFLVAHLSLRAVDHGKKRPTTLSRYPCAGALAEIGVKGVEAAAEYALGRGAAVTDTEVRLVAAIVTRCFGEDLGRAYCTFKRDQGNSDDSRAVMERVLAKIGAKED